ncbi:MAG TPA: efflux RND transporter periplasmic adaptor subunit [Acidobacteriaceae bacterium]|nr:efflux RND transporter periplasmic adaptor subunit [Acidobacteriaceae bacterium]
MAAPSPQDLSQKRRNFWVMVALVLLAAAILLHYSSRDVTQVRMGTAEVGELVNTVATNGVVQPTHNFAAYSPLPGIVKAVYVHEGERVKKGQLLISLDDSQARTQVAAALAAVRGAQAQLEALRRGGTRHQQITMTSDIDKAKAARTQQAATLATLEKLQQQGAASTSEVDAARRALAADDAGLQALSQQQTQGYAPIDLQHATANLENAQAAYASALDTLQKENVRAPFAGTVYSVSTRTSDFVPGGFQLLQMADLKQIQVEAYFDEPEIGKLAVGQPVSIVWAALPNRVWHGHVIRTPSTIITYGTRNVGEALVSVDDADETLLPNTNVTITVVLNDLKNVLLIPREALRIDDSGDYVYRVDNGHLKRIRITIGALNLMKVQVISGLHPGDVVALSAVDGSNLHNGQAVRRAE